MKLGSGVKLDDLGKAHDSLAGLPYAGPFGLLTLQILLAFDGMGLVSRFSAVAARVRSDRGVSLGFPASSTSHASM